jgi:molybdopterin-guanine dinucleotide biosynthesis protein A
LAGQTASDVTALILAGGGGRRLGGVDKGLVMLDGRPLIEWSIAAVAPQVAGVLISANRHLERYRAFGFPVVQDAETGVSGPLAGIVRGLEAVSTPLMLTLPCDAPCVPVDLVARLLSTRRRRDVDVAVAHDGERAQWAHLLISVGLHDQLSRALADGVRGVGDWVRSTRHALSDFSDKADCFANVNTLEQLEAMQVAATTGKWQSC